MSDMLTEIGNGPELGRKPDAFDPAPSDGWCRCTVCNPEWYARRDALDKLDVLMDSWSDALVDAENSYTDAGDDRLFDVLHTGLNKLKDALVEELGEEEDRLRDLRGE